MREKPPCPNCGRPMSLEYHVEEDACQFWREIDQRHSHVDNRSIADCFNRTAKRIRALEDRVLELAASKRAAQESLRRRHDAQTCNDSKPEVVPAMFPDDARITS